MSTHTGQPARHMVSRLGSWASRGANWLRARDGLVAAALFAAGLVAYITTLAPTLLDGDAALFQYTPSVLGVTYPTGYPTYILLGRLWISLISLGQVAYRMNLFSAVCGALALTLLYPALRRLLESRLAAALAVLIFATLPTYWRWATEAKIYTLHILFLSGMLWLLARCAEANAGTAVRRGLALYAAPAAVLFGLAMGNHSTTLLLAPGLLLFFALNCRPPRPASQPVQAKLHASRLASYALYLVPLVLLPLLLYLYVPLRAEALLAQEGTLAGLTVPVAVARGLVSDFYHPGPGGLVRYFTAADFTGGVVTNWGWVPRQLIDVYWPLVRDDFTVWGAVLALAGAVTFALWRPRRFWPLFLMYVILIPFVLAYGQGEQSAFLLPSSLMLAIFAGAAVAGGLRLIGRIGPSHTRRAFVQAGLSVALLLAVAWLPVRQAQRNVAWLGEKWNDATYQYWSDVLAHPMEAGAGVLAHWGDLTSMWYMQHVEGLRPDLYGLFPPSEEVVVEWLSAGHDLYIAGPLQGWAAGVETRYQWLPWGRLVRLAPRGTDPLSLLPELPDAPARALFGDRLRLLKAGFEPVAASGGVLPVTLGWQAVDELPADARVSLRLVAGDGTRLAQTDEALLSGWLPVDRLPAGQPLLSLHRFKLPAGMLPGQYRLQLAVEDWLLEDGSSALDLGQVSLAPPAPDQPPDPWGEYKPLHGADFGGEIRLVGYDYSVTRAGQGKGFAARFLWQALRPPAGDYTLVVELVDAQGQVRRGWRHVPAGGLAPTGTWAAGQVVRDQVDLVLPADAPPGEDTLHVRLAWERPDGTRLPAWRGWPRTSQSYIWMKVGEGLILPGVRVVEKEGRLFQPPSFEHPASGNFDGKIRLLGYDLSAARLSPGETLPLTLVWQSLTSDMRESYTVFVHLVGPDGAIHGQWDKEPGRRSKQPTTGWVEGEVVVDPISVPLASDAPPGTYRVVVGFYLAPDGSRLPLRDARGASIGDALELTQIEVAE